MYFLQFFPMQHFGVTYSVMQLKSDQTAKDVKTAKWVNIDQGFFAKFFELCVRMALYCLPNHSNYWGEGQQDGVEYHLSKILSRNTFCRIMRRLILKKIQTNCHCGAAVFSPSYQKMGCYIVHVQEVIGGLRKRSRPSSIAASSIDPVAPGREEGQ